MALEISNTTVRIVDLAYGVTSIDGLVATNVTFVGPAVVAILAGNMRWTGCTIMEPIDSVLWDVDDQRTSVTGAIGLSNFELTNCVFTQVGFALQRVDMSNFINMMKV